MPLIPYQKQQRYTNSKNIGKLKNTGLLFSMWQYLDNTAAKVYYNDPTTFLSTSTAGFSQSAYNTSSYVVGSNFSSSTLTQTTQKPFLVDATLPYNLAGVANAQIDQAVTVDMISNDTMRVAFYANYPSATVTVRVSSDTTFTNTLSWNLTGSTVNIGTVAQPQYLTVATVRASEATITGAPVQSAIIRARFIGVNATAVGRIAPTALYFANNYSMLPGAYLAWAACCVDEFGLEREMDKAELMCGQSVVGETATSDKFTLTFKLSEESQDIMALAVGSYTQIATRNVFADLNGYEVGNTNKILADVVAAPTRGQLALAPNLRIANVQIDGCSNMSLVDFDSTLPTTVATKLGGNQYAYDPATGLMYFRASNIGQTVRIQNYVDKQLQVVSPEPNKLGFTASCMIADVSKDGKYKYYLLKKVQLSFPSMSVEDEGNTQEFEMTAFFSKKGDVEIATDI